MAIVSCPFCGHKVSDKAAKCSKCSSDLSNLTPEKMASLARSKALDKSQSLVNHSMLALLLFLSGFGLMYWWNPEPGGVQQMFAGAAIGIGFCWYIITRIRIMLLKRKK